MSLIKRFKLLLSSLLAVEPAAAPRQGAEPKVIAITIAVPSWQKLPLYDKIVRLLSHIPLSRRTKFLVITGAALLIFYGYSLAANRVDYKPYPKRSSTLERGTPPYDTILPAGKKIEELGGWTRISPPDRNPVYTYTDKINDIPINVSEQPLPESFKTETAEKIEAMAKDFNATGKITVGGTTIHIGASDGGPQSVIFSKNDLLILIKSSARLDNNQWAQYVNSLK